MKMLFVTLLLSMSVSLTSAVRQPCPTGMKNILTSPLFGCYALVDPAKGLLTFEQAEDECRAIHFRASPVVMNNRGELEHIIQFAIDEGLPRGGKAGFWLGYFRDVEAPLEANGTLSAGSAAIRKDRSLFHYRYGIAFLPG